MTGPTQDHSPRSHLGSDGVLWHGTPGGGPCLGDAREHACMGFEPTEIMGKQPHGAVLGNGRMEKDSEVEREGLS